MNFSAVILAAGKGTRMYSNTPKVLHTLAGKPMVKHVIDTCNGLGAQNIHLVYGHGGDQMKATLAEEQVNWALQAEQLGTGHAVDQASAHFADDEKVLVLYGDVPLISAETIENLLDAQPTGGIALLTVVLDNPTGYGRIVRDEHNKVVAIVEQKDATDSQLAIKEVNTGILLAPNSHLQGWLAALTNNNVQGEYYLTDVIAMAARDGVDIVTVHPENEAEVAGVNDRIQLAALERELQHQQAITLMQNGATLFDPARIDIRGELTTGQDVIIDVNCVFEGNVVLGNGVEIGPNCHLKNCLIGDNTIIKSNTMIDESEVGDACDIGPFARLRPGTVLANNAKIGNFVETKKALIGEGSKVNHLSYIGDTEMGANVNVGAGTITCNYDGVNKHLTQVADNVFIGSNTSLVAPVQVAEGATIAAGSTITKQVGEKQLAFARARQTNKDNWPRPTKK